MADGAAAKVLGTPSVFVNGKRLNDKSFDGFKRIIQDELAALHASPTTAPARKSPSGVASQRL